MEQAERGSNARDNGAPSTAVGDQQAAVQRPPTTNSSRSADALLKFRSTGVRSICLWALRTPPPSPLVLHLSPLPTLPLLVLTPYLCTSLSFFNSICPSQSISLPLPFPFPLPPLPSPPLVRGRYLTVQHLNDGERHITDEDWRATACGSPAFASGWAVAAGVWLLRRGRAAGTKPNWCTACALHAMSTQ